MSHIQRAVRGERWLITGAGSGIGCGLALALKNDGADVVACVRDEAERTALSARVAGLSILEFDVRDESAVRAGAALGDEPVDVLVACAAYFGRKFPALETDFDEALDLYSVNALGPLRALSAFAPRLRRGTCPRVGFISSELGSMTVPGWSNLAYRASKAGLNKITQGLAEALRPEGIAVVALEPGWVRTAMGGPDAPMSVEESVVGLLSNLRGLTLEKSGRFLSHSGEEVAW